jgi:GntR family transcriptional regulator
MGQVETTSPPRTDAAKEEKFLFRPTERFFLDPRSPVPLYHQMEQIILDRIVSQRAVGYMLPRDFDLVTIFGVSRATTKKATDNLVAKGIIRRKRAVGTWIIGLGLREDLGRLTSYSEQMTGRGLRVSTQVLDVSERVPSALAREKLQLAEGDRTLSIRRLRGTSEVFPVVLLHSEIPVNFGIDRSEDFQGSLYKLLEEKYRIPIECGDEEIWADHATPEEAHHLRIPAGSTVLSMERITYTHGNRPVELVRAIYRPEHYKFSVRLKR